MRIGMVGPFGLHPNKTMHSRALGLARALAQRGHAVQLFMPPWQTPAEADRTWQEDGVTLRYVPLRGGVPGITRQLLRELLAWRPDVVHSFKPKAYSGLVAWWLWQTRRRQLRLVTDTDDWEGWGGWNDLAPYSALQKRFFAWQEGWGLRHCHALTVASRALQTLAWSAGVPRTRVVYLPNGAGISQVLPADEAALAALGRARRAALGLADRPVLLLYSRLFEFDTARLVAILQRVQTTVPNLAILSVGTGLLADDAARLRQQLAAAGLTEQVVDAGWVDTPDLPALIAAADAGVYLMEDTLLNRTKCPVKLADMLAAGLPVAAEAVGQVPEYVQPDVSGRLRASGDVAGLAADLTELLLAPDVRRRLAAGARARYADRFAWARLAAQLEGVYGA